jgi:hypothetical protein
MEWRAPSDEERVMIKKKFILKELFVMMFVGLFDIGLILFTIYSINSDIKAPNYSKPQMVYSIVFYGFVACILFFTIRGVVKTFLNFFSFHIGKVGVADCIIEELDMHFMGRRTLINMTAVSKDGVRYTNNFTSMNSQKVHKGENVLLVRFGNMKEKEWKLIVPSEVEM